jgi:hypothetical protein
MYGNAPPPPGAVAWYPGAGSPPHNNNNVPVVVGSPQNMINPLQGFSTMQTINATTTTGVPIMMVENNNTATIQQQQQGIRPVHGRIVLCRNKPKPFQNRK